MSLIGWTDSENMVYMYTMEYYSAIQNKEMLIFATTWIEFEGIMLNYMQAREIQTLYITYKQNVKKKMGGGLYHGQRLECDCQGPGQAYVVFEN